MPVPSLLAISVGLLLALEKPKELDALQGQWVLVETADEKRSDRGDERIGMVIVGNDAIMKFGELQTNQATIEARVFKGTRQLDMKMANGTAVQGVYELAGEFLTICIDDATRGRPGTLTPKGTQWLEKWQRVNP